MRRTPIVRPLKGPEGFRRAEDPVQKLTAQAAQVSAKDGRQTTRLILGITSSCQWIWILAQHPFSWSCWARCAHIVHSFAFCGAGPWTCFLGGQTTTGCCYHGSILQDYFVTVWTEVAHQASISCTGIITGPGNFRRVLQLLGMIQSESLTSPRLPVELSHVFVPRQSWPSNPADDPIRPFFLNPSPTNGMTRVVPRPDLPPQLL